MIKPLKTAKTRAAQTNTNPPESLAIPVTAFNFIADRVAKQKEAKRQTILASLVGVAIIVVTFGANMLLGGQIDNVKQNTTQIKVLTERATVEAQQRFGGARVNLNTHLPERVAELREAAQGTIKPDDLVEQVLVAFPNQVKVTKLTVMVDPTNSDNSTLHLTAVAPTRQDTIAAFEAIQEAHLFKGIPPVVEYHGNPPNVEITIEGTLAAGFTDILTKELDNDFGVLDE